MAIRASYRWRSKWLGDGLTRRAWLGAALALPAARAAREPAIEIFDLSLLDDPVTHNELFFVREHFPAPAVSTHDWKLSVSGRSLTYDQLTEMPSRSVAATIECAENPVGGGLVSHAVWEGVPLAEIAKRTQAPFLRLRSRDGFTRVIPTSKALHPDTLLVLRMNGDSLAPSHGGPVRALVPGWYGMDSVKWLEAIEPADAEDTGKDYRRGMQSLLGASTGDAVRGVQVKSVFARPMDGAVLSGRKFILRGAAWAGEQRVSKVEVSTDGGASWRAAQLGERKPYCWALWQSEWRIPAAGEHRLAVRATDEKGAVQPAQRDSRRADAYEQNHIQHITVTAL